MPDRLNILSGRQHRAQVEADLPEELVGPEPVIVPDGHLEDSGSKVTRTNSGINETLIPLRIAGIHQRFRATLGQLSVSSFFNYNIAQF